MRSIAGFGLLFTLTACSSVLPGSNLTGDYAADRVEIRATETTFTVELPCQAAEFARPVQIGDDGRFRVSARMTSSSVPTVDGEQIRVLGRLSGDTLIAEISLVHQGRAPSWTSVDTLIRGRRSEWTGGRMCAA